MVRFNNIPGVIDQLNSQGFSRIDSFLDRNEIDQLMASIKPKAHLAESEYGTSKRKEITLSIYDNLSARKVIRDVVFSKGINSLLGGAMTKIFVEHSKVLVKAPTGQDTPWHQDGAFWSDFDPEKTMFSIWIALEETSELNGCLQLLVPKDKTIELLPHDSVRNKRELEINESEIERLEKMGSKFYIAALNPGDALIFDSLAIHRAFPNQTDKPRIGIKIVFQDELKRDTKYRKHISSMELAGIRGFFNKIIPCSITKLKIDISRISKV